MSYKVQADVADDGMLRRRVIACAAALGVDAPEAFALDRRWLLSAQPGWVSSYQEAVMQGSTAPGSDESVVTDEMIFAGVRLLAGIDLGPEDAEAPELDVPGTGQATSPTQEPGTEPEAPPEPDPDPLAPGPETDTGLTTDQKAPPNPRGFPI